MSSSPSAFTYAAGGLPAADVGKIVETIDKSLAEIEKDSVPPRRRPKKAGS